MQSSRPGFELVSPCPFPTTITTTPWRYTFLKGVNFWERYTSRYLPLLTEYDQSYSCIELYPLYRTTRNPSSVEVIFTNPSARAGYDTRSFFKRSLTCVKRWRSPAHWLILLRGRDPTIYIYIYIYIYVYVYIIIRMTKRTSLTLSRHSSRLLAGLLDWIPCPCWANLYTYLPNPSARAGYETRWFFKRSLTGLNSVFLLLD